MEMDTACLLILFLFTGEIIGDELAHSAKFKVEGDEVESSISTTLQSFVSSVHVPVTSFNELDKDLL